MATAAGARVVRRAANQVAGHLQLGLAAGDQLLGAGRGLGQRQQRAPVAQQDGEHILVKLGLHLNFRAGRTDQTVRGQGFDHLPADHLGAAHRLGARTPQAALLL